MNWGRNLCVCLGILMVISGCASSQWDKQLVSGSTGPVLEIRSSRNPAPAQQAAPQGIDPMVGQAQLQEQLLKQAAMVPMKGYRDYQVGPEDLLQINFLDSDKLSTTARVNGEGSVRLLLVGDVKVSGMTTQEIAKKLSQIYRESDYLKNPQVMVTVLEYRYMKVAVSGAVNKPDQYPLIGPRTLLEVLGMAGGLNPSAGDMIHIMRQQSTQSQPSEEGDTAGRETLAINLRQLLVSMDPSLNVIIKNGDIVFVPFAQSAYVIGAVIKPGNVALQDNMTVSKAIAQSMGQQLELASNTVTVLRVDEAGQRQTIPLDLGQVLKGKQEDLKLKPHDIVYVHESPARRFFFDLKAFLPGSAVSPAMF